MIYTLTIIGGPHDGATTFSPRPYEILRYPDGSVYQAKEPSPACLRWIADDSYAIELHHVGFGDKLFKELSEALMRPERDG